MPSVFPSFETPAMQEAKRRARESFPFFWRELSWEARRIIGGLEFNAVKLAFATPPQEGAPESEHMWVTDLSFDGRTISGTLMNTADFIPDMVAGTEVSAPVEELEDWMYSSGGVVCGGFTVQAMRAEMPEAERKMHDSAWGLAFTAPELCNITPYAVSVPEAPKGLARMFKKAPPAPGLPYEEALAHARAHEHPMSENMRESFAKGLAEQPSLVDHVLDSGLSMLQSDALAGNLAPVEVLLAAGADRSVRTDDGRTALDLAESMNWPRVIAALRA